MTANGTDRELNPPPTPAHPGSGVTRDQVHHVAALASLELSPQEEERMERDLNAILGYVAELNELDTTHVEPMTQVSEILAGRRTQGGTVQPAATGSTPGSNAEALVPKIPIQVGLVEASGLREDTPRPSLARAIVMGQAPATDGTFFKVPKVIER